MPAAAAGWSWCWAQGGSRIRLSQIRTQAPLAMPKIGISFWSSLMNRPSAALPPTVLAQKRLRSPPVESFVALAARLPFPVRCHHLTACARIAWRVLRFSHPRSSGTLLSGWSLAATMGVGSAPISMASLSSSRSPATSSLTTLYGTDRMAGSMHRLAAPTYLLAMALLFAFNCFTYRLFLRRRPRPWREMSASCSPQT